MIRVLSVVLSLSFPVAAFAADPVVAPAADTAAAPVAEAPPPALLPTEPAPQVAPAVAEARYCSAHHCGRGGGKLLVLTGVTATVLTAVAVGVAVAVATSNNQPVLR